MVLDSARHEVVHTDAAVFPGTRTVLFTSLVMRTASVIARNLAGVIFLVMGLNGFLNFILLPPPGGIAGQFMGALYVSHYLWVIFA
jgi:hypothetical protein